MRLIKRIVCVLVPVGTAMFQISTATAWAAPPSNDTFGGATVISSVPYSTSEDTTQATLDDADSAAVQACGASGYSFGNSVWFAYTPSSDQVLRVDTSGSNYPVAGAVLTGTPTAFSAVSCFLGSQTFQATQGTTYYIDLPEFEGTGGGTLNLSIAPVTPPNPVLTVDTSGQFDVFSGDATVSGTASCSAGSFGFLEASLSTQAHGRNAAITAFGIPTAPIICDGTPHPWSLSVAPMSGLFRGGPATAQVQMFACSFICQTQQVSQIITLKQ